MTLKIIPQIMPKIFSSGGWPHYAPAASAIAAGAELLPAGVSDELARLRRQVVSPSNLAQQAELRALRRRAVEAEHLDDRVTRVTGNNVFLHIAF